MPQVARIFFLLLYFSRRDALLVLGECSSILNFEFMGRIPQFTSPHVEENSVIPKSGFKAISVDVSNHGGPLTTYSFPSFTWPMPWPMTWDDNLKSPHQWYPILSILSPFYNIPPLWPCCFMAYFPSTGSKHGDFLLSVLSLPSPRNRLRSWRRRLHPLRQHSMCGLTFKKRE